MGLLEDEIWPRHTKILMQEMLFLSQKQIAVRWMQVAPPSVNQWMKSVDQILPYKKKKKCVSIEELHNLGLGCMD